MGWNEIIFWFRNSQGYLGLLRGKKSILLLFNSHDTSLAELVVPCALHSFVGAK